MRITSYKRQLYLRPQYGAIIPTQAIHVIDFLTPGGYKAGFSNTTRQRVFCIRAQQAVESRLFSFLSYYIQRFDYFLRNNMPQVRVKENEPFEIAMRRFKRSCEKAGTLAEVRRREFYEKPTSERKRKAAAAVKRNLKKVQRESRKFERLY